MIHRAVGRQTVHCSPGSGYLHQTTFVFVQTNTTVERTKYPRALPRTQRDRVRMLCAVWNIQIGDLAVHFLCVSITGMQHETLSQMGL